ncbi:hypothetical protein COTS27_01654 [Spirochaetota bacterium]|nr:hypothetical protein COTS27_01654 [Spirochaetota bacterium]
MSTTSEHSHAVISPKYYIGVFAALMVLTVLTVYTAKYVDLGKFNFLLAMVIAGAKATLVFAIFMGLYWDKSRFHIVIVLSAFLFFVIFIGITALDIVTRGSIYEDEALNVNTQTKLRVEGYFEDIPKGGDISRDDLFKLKTDEATGQ